MVLLDMFFSPGLRFY